MGQTLEDLKRENAAAEAEQAQAPQAVVETDEADEGTAEEPEGQQLAEADGEEGEKAKLESWQITDEQTSGENGKLFTSSDIKAAKSKLKSKLKGKDSEIEELKDQIQSLKHAQAPQSAPAGKLPPRPKRADFDYDDDAYDAAVDAWNDAKMESKLNGFVQTSEQQNYQKQAATDRNNAVDSHYKRAETLTRDMQISEEAYQGADLRVRTAIEQIRPGQGEAVTDFLISNIGEGSEKVMYYLGVNANALNELQNALATDTSGIKASMYLGRLVGEKVSPKKRVSRAPAPAHQLSGDAQPPPANEKTLKKAYEQAVKSNDMQGRITARRAAKKAGVDVTSW